MHDDTSRTAQHNEGSPSAASMAGAVVLSLIVVAASFILSFSALSELAAMSGAIPQRLTPLLPVVVDTFILQATLCALLSTRRGDAAGRRYHFAMLAIFSATSVAGNAAHAFLVADRGVTHGLLSVAIAIVAPLALLASVHGVVMHVWTGNRGAGESIPVPPMRVPERPQEEADDATSSDAQCAQPQVSGSVQGSSVSEAQHTAMSVSFAEIDGQITDADWQLAHLVCSRGRVKHGALAVARALVCERLDAPKEEAAIFIGAHRTTIGRWLTLSQECRSNARAHNEQAAHSELGERALVDAH
ncbi:DUF2637 domain-containing protein (plasmid) [Gordonia amicalis]|uniref:DUF2637 domain-containing protein n=1 Tax=Gordonia TaxID=2053 RepID=UPI0002A650AD|nr:MULTISPECIES: DUF2637 domain-containing protein [Gordonia]MDH3026205.1 DUF2637 domain-containing protein [Gordonia alkanivorans]NKX79857.1 DUF2637 domain-containing protein [Gordonia amicalis]UOG23695.1 DUF2637 domain-containing protein [Gordonia amicalis]UPW16430.1 DUF2637 domain-containing protein [Gordonia amicalis]GAC55249.1 hypothetical protein GOAMI_49_00160 [Gordonia amicalis NBRC 100051 = JCM 11271]